MASELSEGALLHGTTALAAVRVAVEGFRLPRTEECRGGQGALGHGIYVTRSLAWAAEFMRDFAATGRGVVVEVGLAPGTRVLRLDGNYDPRVIDSLRREFGAGILGPDFHKALPHNKHLRARELIELLNHMHARSPHNERWESGWTGLGGIRHELRKAGYAAFGCDRSDLGIVVFDPGMLRPRSFWRFRDPVALESHGPGRLEFVVEPQIRAVDCDWLRIAAQSDLQQREADFAELLGDPEGSWYTPEQEATERATLARCRQILSVFDKRQTLGFE